MKAGSRKWGNHQATHTLGSYVARIPLSTAPRPAMRLNRLIGLYRWGTKNGIALRTIHNMGTVTYRAVHFRTGNVAYGKTKEDALTAAMMLRITCTP